MPADSHRGTAMHIALLLAAVLAALVWGLVHLQRETRRREWARKNITPLYSLEEPRDLVAVLAFAFLKCGGEITREQKESLLQLYQEVLKYSDKQAGEMYSYASYLITTDPNFADKVREIARPGLGNFSEEQRESVSGLLRGLVEEPVGEQVRFLMGVEGVFGSGTRS
ncbi:MAG: hypothetical protein MRY76_00210 [Pseudomonadales bacterium]|nr:hypothetical protein [Pseudomonadales bacterium]